MGHFTLEDMETEKFPELLKEILVPTDKKRSQSDEKEKEI